MKILGIDTSTNLLSVGMYEDGYCLGEVSIKRHARHTEMLTDVIQQLLALSAIGLKDVDGVAVVLGPGSFTGLRIALGTAKGLALGCEIPLVGVPTTDAYLSGIPCFFKNAVVLINSRKNEFYCCYYEYVNNQWVAEKDIQLLMSEDIISRSYDSPYLFLGEGSHKLAPALKENVNVVILPEPVGLASGFRVAEAASRRFKNNEYDDVDSLIPLYYHKFQGVD
ncbi:tRNA (adenosine(37)-N6)-threonylcarbamoyltransferase complex dimerization subunit type 1 TsaB [bacterium]|nr:tRNA (adenosine(37)-N6)-threonylcarbamoyltransferase complex dimerization subunit type 1 TsaB [bacterium]